MLEEAHLESVQTKEQPDYSELYQAVNMLKDELRIPVILYYMEDFNVKEIAQILEISEGATYAGGKLYQMYMEQKGSYSVEIGFKSYEEIILPEKVHDISFSAGFMPEGMEWVEGSTKICSKDTPAQGGILILSVFIDGKNASAVLKEKGVSESESFTAGDYEGLYVSVDEVQISDNFEILDEKIFHKSGKVH